MKEYTCHWSSNDAYPFCFGAKTPQGFAENDCRTCPWYSEYWRKRKMDELAKIKEFNTENVEVVIYEYSRNVACGTS